MSGSMVCLSTNIYPICHSLFNFIGSTNNNTNRNSFTASKKMFSWNPEIWNAIVVSHKCLTLFKNAQKMEQNQHKSEKQINLWVTIAKLKKQFIYRRRVVHYASRLVSISVIRSDCYDGYKVKVKKKTWTVCSWQILKSIEKQANK